MENVASQRIFPVPPGWAEHAHVNAKSYSRLYAESINDPETFWAKIGQRLQWMQTWTRVKNTSFTTPVSIKWYEGAKINVAVNCIDRHLAERGSQTAIIWEAD